MYLNIVLTILVIVLVTMTILAIVWWKKYGKKLVNSMLDMNKLLPKRGNLNQPDIGGMFNELNKFMSNIKQKK